MKQIKTRRGVFIDLNDSDITYCYNDKVYKFSSQKKKEIFLKRVAESILAIDKLNGKLFRYTEILGKDYNLEDLYNGVYEKVYKNMLYK